MAVLVCTECNGNGFLQHAQRMTPDGNTVPVYTWFADNKQWPETTCPSCLGTKILNAFGT